MAITEEQRQRAEAHRLAALQKLNRAGDVGKRDPWQLFRCQKISTHKSESTKNTASKLPNLKLDGLTIVLEIFSPDEFSISIRLVHGPPNPSKAEFLQELHDFLPPDIQFHYNKSQGGEKVLVCTVKDYDVVLKYLKKLTGIQILEIPWRTFAVVQKFSRSYASNCWVACMPYQLSDDEVDKLIEKLPRALRARLLPFQLDGVRFGLRRGARCLLADEMGLGKTIQAITISSCFIDEGPLLIVCPAVLRFSWAEELERWLPFCLPTDIHLVFGHQDSLAYLTRCPKVVVISYTMLHRLRKSMLERDWALMIIDESHNVRCTKKSVEPDETQVVLDMASKVKRLILLSGTPSLSRPFDIFHQINILWPGLLGKDKYDFANNYCSLNFVHKSKGKIFKDFSGGIRLQELNILLRQTVMIRRLKENVLTQLPPKRRQVIRLKLKAQDIKVDAVGACGMGGGTISMENKHENCSVMNPVSFDGVSEDGEPLINYGFNCSYKIGRPLSYQKLGIAKVTGFCEWLGNHSNVKKGEEASSLCDYNDFPKTLIFAHHIKVLDSVQECVHDKGISFVRIDGRTLAKDRQAAVQAFRSSPEVKIAIIGITAGGVGLDFSSAKNVVFVELPNSASEMLQAEDRAHRRGQTNSVNIYIFCAKDTLDESHWQHLNRSLYRVSSVMNGKEAVQEIKVDGVHNLSQLSRPENSEVGMNWQCLSNSNCDYQEDKPQIEISSNDFAEVTVECAPWESLSTLKETKPVDCSNIINCLSNPDPAISQLEVFSAGADHICSGPPIKVENSCCGNNAAFGGTSSCQLDSKPLSFQVKGIDFSSVAPSYQIGRTCILEDEIYEPSCSGHKLPMNLQKRLLHLCDSDKVFNEKILEAVDDNSGSCIEASLLRFLVSQYTGRIHLYACVPGRDLRPRPLHVNFMQEEVESSVNSSDNVLTLKVINDHPACHSVLLAFIKEWNGLRSIERSKLLGKPLQLPLAFELLFLKHSGNHLLEGLLKGGSNRRLTPLEEVCNPLPADAVWKKIIIRSGSTKKTKEYQQAWNLANEPLCKLCQTPCCGDMAKEPEFFEDLFCSLNCFSEYRMRTSEGYLRSALFQIERGVCTLCKLDCHRLVECIRPLSVPKRREHVQKVASKLANNQNMLEKLVHDPVEGNAWHADHIIPVYKGGGECLLENMRTLCVACHAEVTAAQLSDRQLQRVKAKETLNLVIQELKDRSGKRKWGDALKPEWQNFLDKVDPDTDELLVHVPGSAYCRTECGTSTVD